MHGKRSIITSKIVERLTENFHARNFRRENWREVARQSTHSGIRQPALLANDIDKRRETGSQILLDCFSCFARGNDRRVWADIETK